jgi:hypothetical protein
MDATKGTVKAVALIIGDNNVRGSLQFVQYPNGSLSLSLSLSLSPLSFLCFFFIDLLIQLVIHFLIRNVISTPKVDNTIQ